MLREGVYVETQEALYELTSRGWLHDGSLNGAQLSGARLNGADLRGAILSRADLSDADLNVAQLDRVRLTGARLNGAALQGSSIMEADLMDSYLMGTNLTDAKLNGTNLTYAALNKAILRNASLREANLSGASLLSADLEGVNLAYANLLGAKIHRSNLNHAILEAADLRDVSLRESTLQRTDCIKANFSSVDLANCDLEGALFGHTILSDTDLSQTKCLDTIQHAAPSFIDVATLIKSGMLPEVFLRGMGLPDDTIDHLADLRRRSVDWQTVLITYSYDDAEFAEELYEVLQDRGVRCWLNGYDTHSEEGDAGVHTWDAMLLCCSKASLTRTWAAREIRWAIDQERTTKNEFRRQKLIPLNLDGYLFTEDCRTRLPMWEQVVDRKHFPFLDSTDAADFDLHVDQLVNALQGRGNFSLPEDLLFD
ncbi:MAG: hypothetical protein CL607_09515 [Anaerolineaceae bacterium]|nr:hypothetical protein [Anaerolineaceae bacterium]